MLKLDVERVKTGLKIKTIPYSVVFGVRFRNSEFGVHRRRMFNDDQFIGNRYQFLIAALSSQLLSQWREENYAYLPAQLPLRISEGAQKSPKTNFELLQIMGLPKDFGTPREHLLLLQLRLVWVSPKMQSPILLF